MKKLLLILGLILIPSATFAAYSVEPWFGEYSSGTYIPLWNNAQIKASNFTATSTTATSTFAGGITGPNNFTVQGGTGNVGIGTTTPQQKFVIGNAGFIDSLPVSTNSTVNYHFLITNNSNNKLFGVISAYGGDDTRYYYYADNNKRMDLGLNSTTAMLNPFNDGTGNGLPFRLAAQTIELDTKATGDPQGTSRLFIDSSGNVGIGTTSPTNKLEVAGNTFLGGNMTATGTATILGNIYGSGAGYINLSSTGLSIAPAGVVRTIFNTGGTLNSRSIIALNSDYIGFSSSANQDVNNTADIALSRGGASKMYVGNGTAGDYSGTLIAGNVGIGTTSPFAKLSVMDTTGSGNPLFVISSSTNGLGTTTPFYVAANGNVGIGTTAPSYVLDVQTPGTTNQNEFAVRRSNGKRSMDLTADGSGNAVMNLYGSTDDVINYFGYTNSQIGNNLTIGGNLNVSKYQFSGGQAGQIYGNYGINLYGPGNSGITGVSNVWIATSSLIVGYSSAVYGDTNYGTGNVLVQGNVGIGTTSPATSLDVVGTTTVEANSHARIQLAPTGDICSWDGTYWHIGSFASTTASPSWATSTTCQ